MSALFDAPNARLSDAARVLGVPGSDREGYDCPECGGHRSVKRLTSGQARCTVCDETYDPMQFFLRAMGASERRRP